MLTPPLQDLLATANTAVDLAVATLKQADSYGQLTPKGDRDYASDLDFRIERQLRDHLAVETPDIAFLGEEEGVHGLGGDRMQWVLDPVDGTVNYVHGLPLYAISLALISGDQPILGVVDIPALGSRFHATRGGGAFHNDIRVPIPPPPPHLRSSIVAIGDYAVGDGAAAKNEHRISVTARLASSVLRVRMLGAAAIDLAWLSRGWLDASITLSNKPWDMCAGVVLARETGHQVVGTDGEEYSIQSAATIAAHPDLLPEVLAKLQDR